MTGEELSQKLTEKLKARLPDCAVRPAFTGTLARLPQRAAVTVGVLREENAEGVLETVLGVRLYAREKTEHTRLFAAVCAAIAALPCAVRGVKREETTFSAQLQCFVTLCTVQAATSAEDTARTAVRMDEKTYAADGVKVIREAQVKRYYAVGEDKPYAAAAGKPVYKIILYGFSGAEQMLDRDDFTLETGGRRYRNCAVQRAEDGKIVVEAGSCEVCERHGIGTQNETEA